MKAWVIILAFPEKNCENVENRSSKRVLEKQIDDRAHTSQTLK